MAQAEDRDDSVLWNPDGTKTDKELWNLFPLFCSEPFIYKNISKKSSLKDPLLVA